MLQSHVMSHRSNHKSSKTVAHASTQQACAPDSWLLMLRVRRWPQVTGWHHPVGWSGGEGKLTFVMLLTKNGRRKKQSRNQEIRLELPGFSNSANLSFQPLLDGGGRTCSRRSRTWCCNTSPLMPWLSRKRPSSRWLLSGENEGRDSITARTQNDLTPRKWNCQYETKDQFFCSLLVPKNLYP